MLLGGISYLLVIEPLLDAYASKEEILTQKRMLVVKLAAAAGELPRLKERLTQLRQAASARKIFLDGSSDAIAAANLQSHIEELANTAGVTISTTEARPPEARGPDRKIGLRIAISGRYESILMFLAAVESGSPPLVLDNIQIHATLGGRLSLPAYPVALPQTPNQPSDQPAEARLDAGLDVYGFRRSGSAMAWNP